MKPGSLGFIGTDFTRGSDTEECFNDFNDFYGKGLEQVSFLSLKYGTLCFFNTLKHTNFHLFFLNPTLCDLAGGKV